MDAAGPLRARLNKSIELAYAAVATLARELSTERGRAAAHSTRHLMDIMMRHTGAGIPTHFVVKILNTELEAGGYAAMYQLGLTVLWHTPARREPRFHDCKQLWD
jgi:hypothetical protein